MAQARSWQFAVVAILGLLVARPALAAPGDTLIVGPGATFVDENTSTTFTVSLGAEEGPPTGAAGVGDVVLSLHDASSTPPRLSLCTAHGPGATVSPNPTPPPPFIGNNPLPDIQCGTAGLQSVAIDGCDAAITAHGYVHADHPNTTYLGMTTIDIRFQKEGSDTEVNLTIHTPKKEIKLGGVVTGTVAISSCP